MKDRRRAKRLQAYARQMKVWNDGTGMIWRNIKAGKFKGTQEFKRVLNPLAMLKVDEREGVNVNDWRDKANA